jgi:hypothetical protein
VTTAHALRSGFSAIARAPAVALAEIAWRWTYGLAALAILAWAFFRFLNSIVVTNTDLFLLNSMLPALMAEAIEHIFRGAGAKLARLAAILLPSLLLLWIPVATAGRAATLRALLPGDSRGWRALLGLHILRAALWLVTNLAFIGALILAAYGSVWLGTPEDPTVFLVIFLALAVVISLISSTLWWYLALAPIFAWADGLPAFAAVVAAQRFARRHSGVVSGVSFLYGVLRLVAMFAATVFTLMVVPFFDSPARPLAIAMLVLITLVYFAVADAMYIARLASYIAIREGERLTAYQPPAIIDEPRARLVLEA